MRTRALCAAALLVLMGGCASTQPDIATLTSNSDQAIWDAGQKALEKRNWDSARQHFRRIIDGFPQSEHAAPSRLALAETYVKEGGATNDLLAVGAYREFLTIYPSNPKSDFAQFEIGEAYFRRKNGPDRDQTDTHEALTEYQRLLDLYPSSTYAEKARERITEARQSLARAEFMAGYFYQRTREACRSALLRYDVVLKEYPDFKGLDEVLFREGECLVAAGRAPEALPHLGKLIQDFPKSPWAEPARNLMATAANTPAVPTPPPPPSPAPAPTPAAGGSPGPGKSPEAPASPSPSPAS